MEQPVLVNSCGSWHQETELTYLGGQTPCMVRLVGLQVFFHPHALELLQFGLLFVGTWFGQEPNCGGWRTSYVRFGGKGFHLLWPANWRQAVVPRVFYCKKSTV